MEPPRNPAGLRSTVLEGYDERLTDQAVCGNPLIINEEMGVSRVQPLECHVIPRGGRKRGICGSRSRRNRSSLRDLQPIARSKGWMDVVVAPSGDTDVKSVTIGRLS